jgi:hypothetical protein
MPRLLLWLALLVLLLLLLLQQLRSKQAVGPLTCHPQSSVQTWVSAWALARVPVRRQAWALARVPAWRHPRALAWVPVLALQWAQVVACLEASSSSAWARVCGSSPR